MSGKRLVTMAEVLMQAGQVVRLCLSAKQTRIWGIPRGGVSAALAVRAMGYHLGVTIVERPDQADLIVDDIIDSGKTMERYRASYPGTPIAALFDKRRPPWLGQWLVMPWEVTDHGHDESAEDAVVRLLQAIGEDPNREGLRETPARVIKAWQGEWASGYGLDAVKLVKKFADGADQVDEMILVSNIPVFSHCEHHMAPFVGVAHVGYIPTGKVITGISKLGRIVDVFARRLQVQERLTNQVADAVEKGLDPTGVGVIIRASHSCMTSRGAKMPGTLTTTSAMRGALREKPEARAEFLKLVEMAERGQGR